MKKLALFLAALLLFSAMPTLADSGEDMTAAIAFVKARVDIPGECTEFHGQNSVRNGETNWEFSWETAEGTEPQMRISVYLRSGTLIENVYTYVYEETEYRPGKTLPVITAEQAQEAAVAFCAKTNPELRWEYSEGAEAVLSGDRYRVCVPRTVGGIPVYNNEANIWVCSQTGRVESYALTHSEKALFSGADGAMTAEDAQNAYIKNGYMRLEYRIFDGQACLVYTPGQTESLIDAVTGEGFNPYADTDFSASNAKLEATMASDEAASGAAATLTPQERKAVEEAAGLISYEAATEKLKAVPYFRIPADAVMEAGNTYKTEDGRYVLRISLSGSAKEEYTYTYGELDGETGEILYYYTSERKEDKTAADAEAAKAVYDAFAAEYLQSYADALAETKTEAAEQTTSIRTERVENGIPVYGNGVSVTVDGDSKITSYRLDWKRDVAFPAAEGILSAEAVYGILFENASPRLSYYAGDGEAALIYALPDREYAFVAAGDGTKLNYNGTPFVQTAKAAYTDIAGHYAEEAILALASIGAGIGDTAFMPDAIITQAEFVGLISNCVMDYYPISGGAVDEARLYSYAVNRGILPAEEEAPDTPLTRELAVAYLLRAMEYGRFAEIPGIFRCDFADADAIDPELYGYVAIAKGLGLINGDGTGHFAPKREMTRGEAAVVIYNYLK